MKRTQFKTIAKSSNYGSKAYFKGFVKTKSIIGRKLDPTTESAPIGANPSNAIYLNLYQMDALATTQTSVFFRIKLKFYAKMFEPTNVLKS